MRGAVLAIVLALPAFAFAAEPPSNHTLVFYNARVALRENRANDALKLWLMRNALVQRGERGEYDAEFRSVVWAALGAQGFCPDGFPKDDRGGAGLWPLGLHNYVVQAMSKGPPPSNPSPFEIFTVGRQQRFVSLSDVLSSEELRTVQFFRTFCVVPQATLMELGQPPWTTLEDRLVAGKMLRHLLVLSKQTLVKGKVQNTAAIDARIFDLDLVLAELQAREARRRGRESAQQARILGVSEQAADDIRQNAVRRWPEGSPQAAFLRGSLKWSADEWLTLSRQRRLFLFAQAKAVSQDPERLRELVLSIIDALIVQKQGEEIESWIGFLEAKDAQELRDALTSGERGRRLLELEPESKFRERAVISLHRGVTFLQAGELQDALRSFAFAMQQAESSRESSATVALSRRWLSYVLARYETTPEVIATLRALVPRQEYNAVIEDLVWRAALRADGKSFERVAASVRTGGAFDSRIARLRPLSQGNVGATMTELRTALDEEPYSTLRFIRLLVEKLEAEDGDVRLAHVVTMKRLASVLEPIATHTEKRGAHVRNADELLRRTQAMLDGLDQLDTSEQGQARALSTLHETFAGSIRLAPADPLPWPFAAPQTDSPSAFTQLVLQPVEWRDEKGKRVFGWRVTE